jgi:two-component system cell cycle sensor histidine kinase/response regulator CckA
MWVFDVDTLQVLAVNQAALTQYGYTRDEFLALTLHDLRPHDDVGPYWRAHTAMRAGHEVHGVFRHRRHDGSLIDVEVRTSTLPIGEGRLRLELATDITVHKRGTDAAQFLDKVTSILTSSLEHSFICRNLASLAVPLVGDWCVVHRVVAHDRLVTCGFAHANPLQHQLLAEVVQRRTELPSEHPAFRAWRSGAAVELSDGSVASAVFGGMAGGHDTELEPLLGAAAALYLPIVGRGQTLAILECVTSAPRPYDSCSRPMALALAERAGLAMTNALLYEETQAMVVQSAREAGRAAPGESDAASWICESTPDGFVRLDGEWALSYVNGEAERLMERPRSELLGRNLWELYPEAVGTSFHRELHRAVAERRPVTIEDRCETFDAWLEVHVRPASDGLAVFLRDVSRQHRALQRMEESEAQYRDFLDSATDLIHILAPDGKVLYANRAWREKLGYTEEEVEGLSVFDVLPPEAREAAALVIESCLRGDVMPEDELVVLTKDGRPVVIRGRSNCRVVNGVPVSTRGIYRDVTTEVEARELLQRAQRMEAATARAKSAFLDRMSHELRTPLTAVIGFAGILEQNRGQRLSEVETDFARRIGIQGRGLLALIEDVLAYSEIESRRLNMHVTSVRLGTLLREVAAHYAADAERAGTELVLDLPEVGAVVDTDAATLRRIVRYLLNDAIASAPQGRVTVALEVEDATGAMQSIAVRAERTQMSAQAPAPSGGSVATLDLGVTIARSLGHVLGYDLALEDDEAGTTTRRLQLHTMARLRSEDEGSAKTLHAILDASPLAIIAFEPGWTVRLWSKAAQELYGWQSSDAIERRLPMLRPEDDAEFRDLLRKALDAPHGIADVPAVHVRLDGTLVDVHVSIAPLRAPDGRLRGFLSIVTDVSERKRLEENLRQAQKMEVVGRLAGGVAHDFNNLLTVIAAHAQFLLADLAPGDVLAEDVHAIRDATGRAAALTRQLLLFAHKQVPQRRIVDLNLKLTNAERMLRRTLGSHIEFVTVPSPESVCVDADPVQMEQLVMNLVLNARDAMPEGGALVVETGLHEEGEESVARGVVPLAGTYALLTVSDTGIGMDEATRRRIFEPFFTTKGPDRGTGLGLATVHAIVSDAGGSIQVESAPGVGTTFRVHIPAVRAAAGHTGEYFHGERALRGNETVLIVEDQDAVRAVAARVLLAYGYTVLQARHGNDALGIVRDHTGTIDLLLTDLMMPEMHGQELASRIRELEPTIRVLFMSGYAETPAGEHELDRSTPLVRKPFAGEDLARAVRGALDAG